MREFFFYYFLQMFLHYFLHLCPKFNSVYQTDVSFYFNDYYISIPTEKPINVSK